MKGETFEEFFAPGAQDPGAPRQPPFTVFDRLREDGGRARVRIASTFLIVERVGRDGVIQAAQRFEAVELDALGDAVRRARCLLLGTPDAHAEAARAQEVAGLKRPRKGRR